MDNEIVIVTIEYHVMAHNSADAIERAMSSLQLGIDHSDLAPYNVTARTITADTGNLSCPDVHLRENGIAG